MQQVSLMSSYISTCNIAHVHILYVYMHMCMFVVIKTFLIVRSTDEQSWKLATWSYVACVL